MIPDPEALGGALRIADALDHSGTGDAPCPACAGTGRLAAVVGGVATIEYVCAHCGGTGWALPVWTVPSPR